MESKGIDEAVSTAWSVAPAGSVVYVCAVYQLSSIQRGLLKTEIERRLVAEIGYLKQKQDTTIDDSLGYISLFMEMKPPLGYWEVDPESDAQKQVFDPSPSPMDDINHILQRLATPAVDVLVSVP